MIMEACILETVDKKAWDQKLCSMGGTIFHSSAWAAYIEKTSETIIPQYIEVVSDERETLGLALGFHQASPRRYISRFTKRLWLDAIPFVKDHNKAILCEVLELLNKEALNRGYMELFIGSYASVDCSEEMKKLNFEVIKRFEFILDLDVSEDDLWRELAHKRRKNIRKARRLGIVLRDMSNDKGLTELRRLQGESIYRIREREGTIVGQHIHTQDDPLKVLIESGHGRIMVAESDGEYVSASLFTCFNGIVYHTISGHDAKALETQAPTLLLWEMILKYRSEGVRKFNLSGCKADAADEDSSEHGIYTYKKAFGADPLKCASGRKVFHKYRERAVSIAKTITGS